MAGKGKFLGFLGKVGNIVGTVIPGAGVAGKLAENASKMIKEKAAAKKTAAGQKKTEQEASAVAMMLAGKSETGAKVSVALSSAWDWTKKNWYIVLPAVLALLWVLFFKKKTTVRRRASVKRSTYTPVRRKKTAQPKGRAWALKMAAARRAKRKKARAKR